MNDTDDRIRQIQEQLGEVNTELKIENAEERKRKAKTTSFVVILLIVVLLSIFLLRTFITGYAVMNETEPNMTLDMSNEFVVEEVVPGQQPQYETELGTE
ncbi:hypothetical protein HZB90_00440, partial [archaeon]|nr:hypothetical protein [archaeon]